MAAADNAHDSPPPEPTGGSPLVVGIGASAGGIRALKTFFSNASPHTGLAYVVILHLSPDHDSRLAEVLQSATTMPITAVQQLTHVEAGHIYVIPPNANLRMVDGSVEVTPIDTPQERRSPVDVFFRTLADTHLGDSVAVVLSGTGSDGTNGIKRIKEQGGLVIAQDPLDAEYSDMPTHAIATGLVDFVLPAAAAPAAIVDYARHRKNGASAPAAAPLPVATLAQILTLLRARTGHDFANYKPATVLRRIERRMALHKQETYDDYAAFLRVTPTEPAALMKELLISVTHFFRDLAAFSALEAKVIPQLFHGKQGTDFVRAWVAGCATGEEAYSIAMLLAEAAALSGDAPRVQVFASDLDAAALARARDAFYTEAEVSDVSTVRLRRFFRASGSGYRIGRELRDLVVFAQHNLIKDPPFSHMDLVTCRNLLIYLNRSAQTRIMETFHFALRPGGFLFLGGSETLEAPGDLFAPFDKPAHIFESRRVTSRPPPRPIEMPETMPRRAPESSLPPSDRISPADLHQRLLDEYGGPSLVVTEGDQVVHVSEGAVRFLEMPAGEPSRDLRKVLIPDLRLDLMRAVHQAARERTAVEVPRITLSEAQGGGAIRVVVRPVLRDGEPPRGYLLVLFTPLDRDAPERSAEPMTTVASVSPTAADDLEDEVSHLRAQLRATIEQYEGQVEEGKASNEELHAMNEELRSAAEELETSKEELQSVNEELTTVNQELKIKIEELGLTNNDFKNFINATDIATVFLDRSQRVKLATAPARGVFNLLPSDIGRKLSDITTELIYDKIEADITHVLDTLEHCERELPTRAGRWYVMRILPYRTTEDRIDGVVMTFIDVTHRKAMETRALAGEQRLRLLIDSAIDYAIFTMTASGDVDSWNAGAERMFGYSADDILGRSAAVLFTTEDREAGAFDEEIAMARRTGRARDERYHRRRDGTRFYCSGVTTRLGEDAALGFAKIARDLTAQREAELQLVEAYGTLEMRVEQRTEQLRAEVERRTAAQDDVTSLMRRLVTAQEEQRTRIARDLHDQVGQQLTALRLTLDRLRDPAAQDVADTVERAAKLASDIDAELDSLAWELRPAVLDDLGLLAALPRFVNEWAAHHGIAAEFRSDGFEAGHLPRDAEVTFYRVTQEALNNVVKHAHATRVDVILETRDGVVSMVIEDDGVGFDAADPSVIGRGIGLAGMRERAMLAGATLEIESTSTKGTSLFLRRPLDAGAGSAEARTT